MYAAGRVDLETTSLESNLTTSRKGTDKHSQSGQVLVHVHKDPRVFSAVLLVIAKKQKQSVFQNGCDQ